ncbi:MAG: trimethylamine methyltransferase family protein [bacterium]
MNNNIGQEIHQASIDLLENPGVKMEHEETLNLFLKNGAKPGIDANVIKIPAKMVEEYVGLCPKNFALTDRKGNKTNLSSTSAPAIWSCPGMHLYENNGIRPFKSSDMADMTRLFDKLENVQGVFGFAMDDIKPNARDVVGLTIIAKNTSKHIRAFCFTPKGGEVMAEMKKVVGDHAWFGIGFTAHGPLRWTNLALDIFRATSGHKIPTTINGEPMAGTSGPVTLAGSAAVGNAEILAGIIAVQLMEPARPCIYNLGLAHTFDMRTMIAVTGGPENALLAKISAIMGRFYNIPSASWVSTESMCPDSQTAMEKMFGFHSHMASGVSNLWGVGQLESELTISPEQAVIDNEMISYVKRYLGGVSISEKSLAVELTRTVGIGGNYLDQMHTAENFESEFFLPKVLYRGKRPEWEAKGKKRMDERALEIAAELSKKEVDNGLTADQEKELQKIADEFLEKAQD